MSSHIDGGRSRLPADRNLRLALLSRTLVGLGDTGFVVVLLWLLSQTSADAGFTVGLGTVALTVPTLVVAPALGPLMDRLHRSWVMATAIGLRLVLLAGLAVWAGGDAPLPVLLGAVAAHAALGGVAAASYNAGLPELVADDDLARANGWTQSALNVAMAAGAASAGAALAAAGSAATFVGLAVIAAAAAVAAWLLPSSALDPPYREPSASWRSGMRAGLRTVWMKPQLRVLIALGVVAVLGFAPALVALVVLVDQQLAAGPEAFGLLQTFTTAGLVVGALVAPRLARVRGPATAMGVALVCMGVATVTLGVVTTVAAAAVMVAARGLSNGVSVVQTSTLLQRHAPAAQRGRVLTVASALMELPRVAAPLLAGLAVDAVGVSALYAVMGAVIGAAGLAALLARPVLDAAPDDAAAPAGH